MENEGREQSPYWNNSKRREKKRNEREIERTKKKRKEREIERKERKGKQWRRMEDDRLLPPFFQCLVNQGEGFVHASRGRCFLLLWLFLPKGHSMTIRFSPNSGDGPKTVSTELLTV